MIKDVRSPTGTDAKIVFCPVDYVLAPRPRNSHPNTSLVVSDNDTQTMTMDATYTLIVAVSTLVYSCSYLSVFAVLAEIPWFNMSPWWHRGVLDAVLGGRPQHAKSHSVYERSTDGSLFLVIFLHP
jgi:hypothetical protein